MNSALIILVSLCFTEIIHNIFEVWGIRQKVQWLKLASSGKPHGRWPLNIDTGLKTVILHACLLLFFSAISFVVLGSFNLSADVLIKIGIILLLFNYAYTTWKVNRFHEEIGELTD